MLYRYYYEGNFLSYFELLKFYVKFGLMINNLFLFFWNTFQDQIFSIQVCQMNYLIFYSFVGFNINFLVLCIFKKDRLISDKNYAILIRNNILMIVIMMKRRIYFYLKVDYYTTLLVIF